MATEYRIAPGGLTSSSNDQSKIAVASSVNLFYVPNTITSDSIKVFPKFGDTRQIALNILGSSGSFITVQGEQFLRWKIAGFWIFRFYSLDFASTNRVYAMATSLENNIPMELTLSRTEFCAVLIMVYPKTELAQEITAKETSPSARNISTRRVGLNPSLVSPNRRDMSETEYVLRCWFFFFDWQFPDQAPLWKTVEGNDFFVAFQRDIAGSVYQFSRTPFFKDFSKESFYKIINLLLFPDTIGDGLSLRLRLRQNAPSKFTVLFD